MDGPPVAKRDGPCLGQRCTCQHMSKINYYFVWNIWAGGGKAVSVWK